MSTKLHFTSNLLIHLKAKDQLVPICVPHTHTLPVISDVTTVHLVENVFVKTNVKCPTNIIERTCERSNRYVMFLDDVNTFHRIRCP